MEDDHSVTQLIDGDGIFNAIGLDNFVKKVKLAECGVSYAVVAIMGPQSSGKSTLMNHLFHTKFREMNALLRRSQTTRGIWMAECVGMEPFTIVMDLEGNDSKERGQEIAFEKQAALFALAISDILLINIWCHDIGREHATNKPLLRTIFEVMMRLFGPRKTTLLFVIRDKTKTPLKMLELDLRDDIQKVWDEIPKPKAQRSTLLSEIFNVQICALSSYEEKEESFKAEVAELRKRFFHSISPGGLASDRQCVVAASGFSLSTQNIWKIIKENKDLDLPSHQVMVSTVRCEEIASKKFSLFKENKDWLKLSEAIEIGPVKGLGKSLSSILNTYIADYDMEAKYFDEAVRNSKRYDLLEKKAMDLALPVYTTMIEHLRLKTSKSFKARLEQLLDKGKGSFASALRTSTESSMLEFDEGCADATMEKANWDASTVRKELQLEIEAVATSIRNAKLFELKINYEKELSASLIEPVESLLKDGESDTWVSIRKLLNRETESVISDFSSEIVGFEIDEGRVSEMVQNLRDTARNVVVTKAREEAGNVLTHMKHRFSRVFSYDIDTDMPVVWKRSRQLRNQTEAAYKASLKLLSVMAAVCLDEKPNNIEKVLFSSLMSSDGTGAPLASTTWDEVSVRDTLIRPVQCKPLWRQLKEETAGIVNQADLDRRASREAEIKWLLGEAGSALRSTARVAGSALGSSARGLISLVRYAVAGNDADTDEDTKAAEATEI